MGTAPKHPSTRRRRNKGAGFRTLYAADDEAILVVPDLPPPSDGRGEWHLYTLRRWEAVMNSPMRSEYTESDLEGLYDLAHLWDNLNRVSMDATHMRVKVMAEIRMQEQRFGLSPMDRRRLQWEIQRGEQAEVRTEAIRRTRAPAIAADDETPAADPRDLLAG